MKLGELAKLLDRLEKLRREHMWATDTMNTAKAGGQTWDAARKSLRGIEAEIKALEETEI